jgi:hypothetical protein
MIESVAADYEGIETSHDRAAAMPPIPFPSTNWQHVQSELDAPMRDDKTNEVIYRFCESLQTIVFLRPI